MLIFNTSDNGCVNTLKQLREWPIRAWWADHLRAQRESGQRQVVYCRDRGLDPKYFTPWKQASGATGGDLLLTGRVPQGQQG